MLRDREMLRRFALLFFTSVLLVFTYNIVFISRQEKWSKVFEDNECEIIRQRALNLQKACEKYQLKRFNNISEVVSFEHTNDSRPWLFFTAKYNAMYCQIPKTGSTHWLRVIAVLNGLLKDVNDMPDRTIHSVPMPDAVVPFLPYNETEVLLTTGIKFMVVRNPLDRLLSAYRGKIESPSTSFRETGRQIVEFTSGETSRYVPTFNEFLSFVGREDESGITGHISINRHWKDFFNLCLPCDIKYDYILTVENIEKESNCLLRAINAPSNLTFPSTVLPVETNPYKIENGKTKHDYYNTVNKNVLHDIIKLYNKDFKLFGYEAVV